MYHFPLVKSIALQKKNKQTSVQNLVEIGPVVLEKKILKCYQFV